MKVVIVNNLIDNNVVKFNEIGGVAAVFLKSRFFGDLQRNAQQTAKKELKTAKKRLFCPKIHYFHLIWGDFSQFEACVVCFVLFLVIFLLFHYFY